MLNFALEKIKNRVGNFFLAKQLEQFVNLLYLAQYVEASVQKTDLGW